MLNGFTWPMTEYHYTILQKFVYRMCTANVLLQIVNVEWSNCVVLLKMFQYYHDDNLVVDNYIFCTEDYNDFFQHIACLLVAIDVRQVERHTGQPVYFIVSI